MSKRLLILIEGQEVTARTLALDLSEAGYGVETAADREEAIRKLRRRAFDLVILPQGRGEGAGALSAREVRRAAPGAKVVRMTTEGTGGRPCELDEAGARVRMPFDLEEFRALLRRLLGGKEAETGKAM
jgi:DNA-binding response OmpR family regulator